MAIAGASVAAFQIGGGVQTSGNSASGISTSVLGDPYAEYPQIGDAASINTTVFGAIAGDLTAQFIASAVQSTALGTVAAYYVTIGIIGTGSRSSLLGRPSYINNNYASSIYTARVGNPAAAGFNFKCDAVPMGSGSTAGTPTAGFVLHSAAQSISSTTLGVPVGYYAKFGYAIEINSTRLGTPKRVIDAFYSTDQLFIDLKQYRVEVMP